MFVRFITCENCGHKDTPGSQPAFHNPESTPCEARFICTSVACCVRALMIGAKMSV